LPKARQSTISCCVYVTRERGFGWNCVVPDGTRRDGESNCFKAIDGNGASCKGFSIAPIGFKSLFPLSGFSNVTLARLSPVEQFDCLSVHVRAQMGIAHCHVDGGVPE
jgi:hypothetical protein